MASQVAVRGQNGVQRASGQPYVIRSSNGPSIRAQLSCLFEVRRGLGVPILASFGGLKWAIWCPESGWTAIYDIVIELSRYLGGLVNVKVPKTLCFLQCFGQL